MNSTSVWAAPFEADSRVPSASPPARIDIAIIGAGITGLSAAYALCKRGFSVSVFETEAVGFGASSRNAGMVLTGLKLAPEELLRRYGAQKARAMFEASLGAIDLVENLVTTERIDCAFTRCGHIEVASKRSHFDAFKKTAETLQTAFNHPVRVLDRVALANELGSQMYFGGLLDERSAALDPARYIRGVASAVKNLGGEVYQYTSVDRFERFEGGMLLRTSRGDVRAAKVFVATGAYTRSPFSRLQRRIVPLGSYVIATEPLPADVAEALIPGNRMFFDSRRLLHYFRLTPDRRMLFGGRAAFVPESWDAASTATEILRRDMLLIFPGLADAGIECAWSGTLDVTFDLMPHVGEADGAFYALGYAGHGVALATLLGLSVAAAITSGSLSSPFSSTLPRAPFGLYDGNPWFLPLVGMWQRFLDWVD